MDRKKKRALSIKVLLPQAMLYVLKEHFPLEGKDQFSTETQIGESHKQVFIHRENVGLTDEQADVLGQLQEHEGVRVNINIVNSLNSPSRLPPQR